MMEEICGASLGKAFNKARPYLLMVGLQIGLAGTYIFSMASLKHGMNRYVLIVYRNAIAALSLAPFAFVFERKARPKMTISVFLQIMALGFLEPVLDQGFAFLGMQYTSAAFASAIMNAVPSVTFVIAVILRMERLKMKEIRSQAKVVGTVVTFAGALLMTLYKGPIINLFNNSHNRSHEEDDNHSAHRHWVAGTVFLLVGCVAWSSFYILQSVTIRRYPAELSLSCLICFVGALQSAAVALVAEHHSSAAWAVGWDFRLFGPLYTGIISSGIAYYLQGVVMQTRGPVFVTAFSPLCMIVVAAVSSFVLAEQLHLGSITGAIIIAVGLYSVVWGKGKDYSDITAPSEEIQKLPITATDISKVDTAEKTNHGPITTN